MPLSNKIVVMVPKELQISQRGLDMPASPIRKLAPRSLSDS